MAHAPRAGTGHSACRSWRYQCATMWNRQGNLSMYALSWSDCSLPLIIVDNSFDRLVCWSLCFFLRIPTIGFVFADKSTIRFPEPLQSAEAKRLFKRIIRSSAPCFQLADDSSDLVLSSWDTTILQILSLWALSAHACEFLWLKWPIKLAIFWWLVVH